MEWVLIFIVLHFDSYEFGRLLEGFEVIPSLIADV